MSEDARIKELEDALQEKLREIEALDNAVQSRDEQMGNLKSELEQMRRSTTWRALMGFHELLEELLPLGTRRRMYYEELIGRMATARKDGGQEKTEEQPKVRLEEWDGERITFPEPPESPDVSIVIPVYNNCGYTYNCLKSVLKNTRGSYEVVVVDDASEDKTPELIKSAENVRVVVNEENLGFVESCNAGVKAANGKYIFFLNNDAFVTENWLEPLMEVMERGKVGAVGSKLVYPDGKMQEAGSIIWKDASSQNYGREDNPEKPEYNFVREVDYCSAAALLVRRELFEKIGGFDARFGPGYYEDTDLCFSLRKIGYIVLYQPRSVVIHFEAVTSGTDITSGMREYLVMNREKFLEKWSDVLEGRYDPDPANLFSARHVRRGKNILIIDHRVPIIDKDSGSCRMHNMLKILIELGHNVTFIGNNSGRFEPHTSILQQVGVEVVYDPYINSMWEYLEKNGKFFDIVILGRAQIAAKHISSVKRYCNKAKLIFDTVDLQFLREQRRAEVENDEMVLRQANRMKRTEFQLARGTDVTFVVTPVDKAIMLKEDPSLNVEIISNIDEVRPPERTFSERSDMMFLGGFSHLPNVDAVKWFVEEIFPVIKGEIPDAKFYVVGVDPPTEIKSLGSDDVIVTGYVKDLVPYFEKCKVFVSPLRYGAGVKGKINRSMSHGVPVVTTSIGAEGMELVDGENTLIADEPAEFAKKVVTIYKNEELWGKLSRNSLRNVQEYYSYETARERLKEIIGRL